ncbi:uncharacterized protein HMPREF1120_07262 [Exophiala dermatitidis NIH/UT8656]|uniref:Uncharacterized protein n=1 Tax=Exophiala dermatitidis (strain ATCC 34100 / CBS 525.76 / NIH/UT8656) TaxID=858893 RepID=H6C6C3_EXODN|nr:uncharacterized protein HMPREF1120_07262 [Exophiala dermatitidis NIH/UT8656]EHY59269.1 hypothetical protein HMPREF1120_07262 [Exophiala dermatitidis NIH/UT8656]
MNWRRCPFSALRRLSGWSAGHRTMATSSVPNRPPLLSLPPSVLWFPVLGWPRAPCPVRNSTDAWQPFHCRVAEIGTMMTKTNGTLPNLNLQLRSVRHWTNAWKRSVRSEMPTGQMT